MSEIKFKSGTTVKDKTVNDGDIVMINNTMGSANSDSADDKLGSVYKGSKIVGTTKADELCLTEDLNILGVTVGNVGDGKEIKSFKKGDSLDDILRQIFTKVTDVTVLNPSASLSIDPSGIIHVGESGNVTLTGTYTDGKFTGTETWSAQCEPTTMSFKMNDTSIGTASISNNSATYNSTIDTSIETSYTFKCAATYKQSTQNAHKKNDGSNSEKSIAAGTTSDSSAKTIYVKYKWFYSVDGGKTFSGDWTGTTSVSDLTVKNGDSLIILCPPGYAKAPTVKLLSQSWNWKSEEKTSITLSVNGCPETTYTKYERPVKGANAPIELIQLNK